MLQKKEKLTSNEYTKSIVTNRKEKEGKKETEQEQQKTTSSCNKSKCFLVLDSTSQSLIDVRKGFIDALGSKNMIG